MREKQRVSEDKVLVGILLVGLDQATKFFFRARGETMLNYGIGWGIANGAQYRLVVVIVSMVALGYVWRRKQDWRVGLIMVGGISNLIDRVRWGGVIDWLRLVPLELWVNLADVYVTIGVLALVFNELYGRCKNKNTI